MQLACRTCGSIWLTGARACSACGSVDPPATCTTADGLAWARLEVRFACPNCSLVSPLHQLLQPSPVGATMVDCAYCGAEHGFDPTLWGRLLPQAHEVVDLAGSAPHVKRTPALQGPRNPHLPVGTTIVGRELEEPHAVGGRAPVRVRVAPGHPVDAGEPLGWRREPHGLTVQAAPRPGAAARASDVRSYTLPPAARETYAALAGILSASRADGVANAALVHRDGATQICCPSCGGPGEADAAAQLRCVYCGVLSLVSNRAWHRLGRRPPEPAPVWVLFAGPSAKRQGLTQSNPQAAFQAELRARALAAMRGGK